MSNINKELDYSKLKHPYIIGENYYIRCVTYHYTGKLLTVFPLEIVIDQAAWIADGGRFKNAVEKGTFSEIEPFPEGPVIIGRGTIVDAKVVSFPLPRLQK